MVIEEFWIINWDGITLFRYSPNGVPKLGIMGGFFSAIQSFAKNIGEKKEGKFLNAISIGDSTYNFLANQLYRLHFILKSSVKVKDKIIKRYLKKFEYLFIEEYRRLLITFGVDVSQFANFEKQFEKE